MTLGMGLMLLGLLLMYAGFKGLSPIHLLLGNSSTPSKKPQSARQEEAKK